MVKSQPNQMFTFKHAESRHGTVRLIAVGLTALYLISATDSHACWRYFVFYSQTTNLGPTVNKLVTFGGS